MTRTSAFPRIIVKQQTKRIEARQFHEDWRHRSVVTGEQAAKVASEISYGLVNWEMVSRHAISLGATLSINDDSQRMACRAFGPDRDWFG